MKWSSWYYKLKCTQSLVNVSHYFFSVHCRVIHLLCIDRRSDIGICNSSSLLILCLSSKCHLVKEILLTYLQRSPVFYRSQKYHKNHLKQEKKSPSSSYVLQDGLKRARTELKGKTINLKAGDAVKQRRNGCFLDEDKRTFLATEPKHLQFSLRHFQKDLLKKVLYMWHL